MRPESANTLQEMLNEIGDAQVRFWVCIVPEHNHVTWKGDVAVCAEEGCAVTSQHTDHYVEMIREALMCPKGMEVRTWKPEDGDRRCQRCGVPNVVWFVDSDLWNEVMPHDGILCIPCFIRSAEAKGHDTAAWHLSLERAGA